MSRIDDLERRVADLERELRTRELPPAIGMPLPAPWPNDYERYQRSIWQPMPGCACLPNTPCGNVACPRRVQVTCVYPAAGTNLGNGGSAG